MRLVAIGLFSASVAGAPAPVASDAATRSFGRGPAETTTALCATCQRARPVAVPAASRSVFLAVEIHRRAVSSNLGPALTNTEYHLLVRTPLGWYGRYLGQSGVRCGGDATYQVRYTPPVVKVRGGTLTYPGVRCHFSANGPPRCE